MVYGLQGGRNPSEASYRHLLDFPFHFQLQKVEVRLRGWLLKTMRLDKKLLILIEKVKKNYRLLLKRLYEMKILENHNNRKKSSFFSDPADYKVILSLSPTTLQ
jgi:hypothetical protein